MTDSEYSTSQAFLDEFFPDPEDQADVRRRAAELREKCQYTLQGTTIIESRPDGQQAILLLAPEQPDSYFEGLFATTGWRLPGNMQITLEHDWTVLVTDDTATLRHEGKDFLPVNVPADWASTARVKAYVLVAYVAEGTDDLLAFAATLGVGRTTRILMPVVDR